MVREFTDWIFYFWDECNIKAYSLFMNRANTTELTTVIKLSKIYTYIITLNGFCFV